MSGAQRQQTDREPLTKEYFGSCVAKMRQERGVTIKEVSRRLLITEDQVRLMEEGKYIPDPIVVDRLCSWSQSFHRFGGLFAGWRKEVKHMAKPVEESQDTAPASIGEAVKRARLRQQWSIPETLRVIHGVTGVTWLDWEDNKAEIPLPKKREIYDAFTELHTSPFFADVAAHISQQVPTILKPPNEMHAPFNPPVSKSVPPKEFNRALRFEREANGMTHEELGRRVGVSDSAVRAWENSVAVPVQENLDKLYEALPNLLLAKAPDSRNIPKPTGNTSSSNPNYQVPVTKPLTHHLHIPHSVGTQKEENHHMQGPPNPPMGPLFQTPTVPNTHFPNTHHPSGYFPPPAAATPPTSLTSNGAVIRDWTKLVINFKVKTPDSTRVAVVQLLSAAKQLGLTFDDVLILLGDE